MAYYNRVLIYLLFLQLSTPEIFCNGNQTCFLELYSSFKENITTKENTVINFTFSLNNMSCWTGKDIRIHVRKNDFPECYLLQPSNGCNRSTSTTTCSCVQDGLYLFHKEMTKNDSGNWKWVVKDRLTIVAERTMLFNIQYPANVLRLEVDGQDVPSYPVVRNKNASIVCVWENGNPSVTARLLDNRGEILNETHQNVTYTYLASNCHNETIITCEADGSRINRSVSLLTICPPVFVHTSDKTVVSTKYRFTFRTYTTNISECSIYKQQNSTITNEIEDKYTENKAIDDKVTCITNHTSLRLYPDSFKGNDQKGQYCSCSMTGTVPNVHLILQLHSLKKKDNGEWILVLCNLAGCNTASFTLHLPETNDKKIEATDYSGLLAGTSASVTIVAVFIIVIFVVKTKGNKGSRKSEEINNCVQYSSPTDYAIHGGITMVVNEMYETSEDFISPVVLSPDDGVNRNEGTVVENNDIYSRVMKKTQGRLLDNDLITKPEGIQSYTNLYYESLSAKKGREMNNVLQDTIEDVPECADPFYGIKNCMQENQKVESGPQENIYSLACSLDENRNSETGLISVADTCNQSDVIDVRKQPQVLHIRNLGKSTNIHM